MADNVDEQEVNAELDDLVKAFIVETVKVSELRLTKTLVPQIENLLRPYQVREVERLKKESDDAKLIFTEVEKTFFGNRAIRKAIKILNRPPQQEKDPLAIFKRTKRVTPRSFIKMFVYGIGILTILFSVYQFFKYIRG